MRKTTQEIIKNTFSYAIRLVQQIRRNSSLSWTRFYFLYIQCAFLPSSSSMLHFGALFWALRQIYFLSFFHVSFFSLEFGILDFCSYTYLLSQSGFLTCIAICFSVFGLGPIETKTKSISLLYVYSVGLNSM